MKRILLIFIIVLSQGLLYGQRKMTSFDPVKNGFLFGNNFKHSVGDPGSISINLSGLCGGMTYAAGDYFYRRIRRPDQDYTPAPGTRLYKHLYSRQLKAHENIAGQMVEFKINPFGARNKEFWGWAVSHKLKQLVKNINANRPTPILMLRENKKIAENHWVMAIGYDLGGYKWRKERDPKVNNVKIFIYDPNHPKKYMVLTPDKAKWNLKYGYYNMKTKKFSEKTSWKCTTFHPNTGFYRAVNNPPRIGNSRRGNPYLIYKLVAHCATGRDDLRGGNDRVSFRVKYSDNTYEDFPNVNRSKQWPNGSSVNVELHLKKPHKINEIRNIELRTNFKGGIGGDNWNLNSLSIDAYQNSGKKHDNITGSHRGSPWKRFTGTMKRIELRNKLYKPKKPNTTRTRKPVAKKSKRRSIIKKHKRPNTNTAENKISVAVDLLKIRTPVHNNDCKRIQGYINVNLRDLRTGKTIKGGRLLNWKGNKSRDFAKRSLQKIPKRRVKFLIDKATYNKGLFEVVISNSLKRCHKKCDMCRGYHCNIRYSNTRRRGNKMKKDKNTYRTTLKLGDKTNRKRDNHNIDLDIIIRPGR